jgi:hypothetical protein
MTDHIVAHEPPPLRALVDRALAIGYEEPLLEQGDTWDAQQSKRVGVVRVQLHSNPARRNVVAVCRVLDGHPGRMVRVAFRSALAKALELANQPEALIQ